MNRATVDMAPVIARHRWHQSRDGAIRARCPLCHTWQVIENDVCETGFTEGAIVCEMDWCDFADWVRLEGWDDELAA